MREFIPFALTISVGIPLKCVAHRFNSLCMHGAVSRSSYCLFGTQSVWHRSQFITGRAAGIAAIVAAVALRRAQFVVDQCWPSFRSKSAANQCIECKFYSFDTETRFRSIKPCWCLRENSNDTVYRWLETRKSIQCCNEANKRQIIAMRPI